MQTIDARFYDDAKAHLDTNEAQERWFHRTSGSYVVVLFREGEDFIMEGPTGEHRLTVAHTDLDRLAAHWAGFCENNRAFVFSV